MPRPKTIEYPPTGPFSVLIVDGGDDERLCRALCPRDVVVVHGHSRGSGEVAATVRVAAGLAGFERALSLGVVTDAEEDPVTTLATARAALAQLDPSLEDLRHGEIRTSGRRYGLFVVPDDVSHGSLETLLRRAWTATARDKCVSDYFTCVGATGATTANRDKAWLKAWAAGDRDPDVRPDQLVGRTIVSGHPAFDPLRTFLSRLTTGV